ncbi:MAG TPA: hypothetical protein PKN95_11690 [Verrucomicrobiota bacterium]|nr:hypothetical protein [Verrucomicrobiota bacterium]HNT14221.1 hypothetical protein [Verrucomicrobiota bacterium]
MPDKAANADVIFNSEFRHGCDEKRRIQIPSAWRAGVGATQFTLILWPQGKEGACLRGLPPKKMWQLIAELDAIPSSDPSKQVLKRFIGSQSVQVHLDKAGRICVPENLATAANIRVGEEVVLVGLLDRFEIWAADRYALVRTADAFHADAAMKRMG